MFMLFFFSSVLCWISKTSESWWLAWIYDSVNRLKVVCMVAQQDLHYVCELLALSSTTMYTFRMIFSCKHNPPEEWIRQEIHNSWPPLCSLLKASCYHKSVAFFCRHMCSFSWALFWLCVAQCTVHIFTLFICSNIKTPDNWC